MITNVKHGNILKIPKRSSPYWIYREYKVSCLYLHWDSLKAHDQFTHKKEKEKKKETS